MAVTEVGNTGQIEGSSFGTSPVTATFGSTTTSGNGAIVAVGWYIGAGATISVADNQGNGAPALLLSKATGNDKVAIYFYKNITGGASHQVTVTPAGGNTLISIGLIEVTGQDIVTQAGATNSGGNTTGTTTPSAGAITPASGSLAVAAAVHDTSNSPTWTAGGGWTRRTNIPGVSGIPLASEVQAGAGSSVTGSFTSGASVLNWSAVVAEIQASAGGGGGAQAITPTGLASAENFGTAVVSPGSVSISPSGITSTESFGTAVVAAGAVNIAPSGIVSLESFGTAVVAPGAVAITPLGIGSAESFGTAVVAAGVVNIAPGGIASLESFGSAVVSQAGSQSILPAGIGSLESFGTTVLAAGPVSIQPDVISSTESFGTAVVSLAGSRSITPAGIGSAESFGTATIAPGPVSILPAGMTSLESFGTATVAQPNGNQSITVSGIGSLESFGSTRISVGASIVPSLYPWWLFPGSLYPLPLYPDITGSAGGNPDFLSALHAYLSGLPSLSSLTKIHLNKAKKPRYPFMVISSNFTPTPTYNTGPNYWEEQPIQFTVFSRDDTEALTLGRAAYAALLPLNTDGSIGTRIVFDDGYEMARFPDQFRLVEQPGQGPGQLPVFQGVWMTCFLLGRTMGV